MRLFPSEKLWFFTTKYPRGRRAAEAAWRLCADAWWGPGTGQGENRPEAEEGHRRQDGRPWRRGAGRRPGGSRKGKKGPGEGLRCLVFARRGQQRPTTSWQNPSPRSRRRAKMPLKSWTTTWTRLPVSRCTSYTTFGRPRATPSPTKNFVKPLWTGRACRW